MENMDSLRRSLSLARRGLRNYLIKRPLCISFEVTHSCNAKCSHCHLHGPVKEDRASPERLGEICREISPVVAQASGGEPLLRKDLEQIIQAWRVPNRAPFIVVTTNATLLTLDRYKSLREAGVDEFSISLDYPDERHDEFRGVPGLYRKIEKLVQDIDAQKDKAISLCCVIQSDNFRSLLQMAELARKWNVRLNFSAYTTLRTHDKSYTLAKEDLEEFREVIKNLLEFQKKYKKVRTSKYVFFKWLEYFDKGYMPNCRTGERFFNVNPNGTISPCGLIITNYETREEFIEDFCKNNSCVFCYTSIRANTEKSLFQTAWDNLHTI
ncbi:MAG: radical SAM protein [Candidatus Aminicenantes bacterium]|nr:radical SAM protein [Candidatus Aminicenantes bacterium]